MTFNDPYYCAICNNSFDSGDLTSNTALDFHLRADHGHEPNRDNGTATLQHNGVKTRPVDKGFVLYGQSV